MSGDTSILGLALSSAAGGPATLWVYYTAVSNTQQLVRINLDNPADHSTIPILFGLTTLVPLTTNDGVALLGPSMVRVPGMKRWNDGTISKRRTGTWGYCIAGF